MVFIFKLRDIVIGNEDVIVRGMIEIVFDDYILESILERIG